MFMQHAVDILKQWTTAAAVIVTPYIGYTSATRQKEHTPTFINIKTENIFFSLISSVPPFVPLATGMYKASLLELASPHTFCLFSSGMSDDGTGAVSHKQHHGLSPFFEHLSGVREPTPFCSKMPQQLTLLCIIQ
jgi:hypothetical protein